MKPLEPPDRHHVRAALGWLELGNPAEANEELKRVAPELQAHPAVLMIRYDIHAQAKEWGLAAEAAAGLLQAAPDEPIAWINLAYATRRKPSGSVPAAREILIQAQSKFPGHSLIPFNLACYDCQLGNLEAAKQWLSKAFAHDDAAEMKMKALADPDLEPMWQQIREM